MSSRRMIVATLVALFVIAFPLASMQAGRKIYKVSDGGVTPPKLVHKEEPRYTAEAKEAGIQGQVTLSVIIEENGTTGDIKVVETLDAGLDENAIKAVAAWRFEPAQKDGQPVPVLAEIKVNFRLLP